MKRRALLASAGSSLAALTGCLDRAVGHEPTATGNAGGAMSTESGQATSADDPLTATSTAASVTVESVVQQHGFVTLNDDAINIVDVDTHYLIADVSVEGGFYERGSFTFHAGDTAVEPTRIDQFYRVDWGEDRWYEQGRERGLLLFELPDELGSGVPRIAWLSGEWEADEGLGRRLRSPRQAFSASLSVPNASDGSTEKTVEVEVTNEGDSAERYLGALNRVGPAIAYAPVARVSGLVEAGETRTFEVDDSWSDYPSSQGVGDGERDVTYRLDDADGGAKLEIAVSE